MQDTIKTRSKDTAVAGNEILATFTDSVHIGEKGKCKAEIIKYRVLDDLYVIVKFYTKGPVYWYLQNTYQYETNAQEGLQPDISDYNNDNLNDLTFISANAARGANEVRRLFIYNPEEHQLISVVNAEEYPNMQYNKELNCIDAFLVYGGCSTVFARIDGDSLKTFAGVDNSDYRVVYEMDKNGNQHVISKDTLAAADDIYVRYENYKPPKVYSEPEQDSYRENKLKK